MKVPFLIGIVYIRELVTFLLAHQPRYKCEKMEEIQEVIKKFQALNLQLAARFADDFGLTTDMEKELCKQLIQVTMRHEHAIHDHITVFLYYRLVLTPAIGMTEQEAIDFVSAVVEESAPPGTGWTISWPAYFKVNERNVANADICNESMRKHRQFKSMQSSLRLNEVMHADTEN